MTWVVVATSQTTSRPTVNFMRYVLRWASSWDVSRMIRVVSDDGSANFVSLQAYVFMSNVTRPQSAFRAQKDWQTPAGVSRNLVSRLVNIAPRVGPPTRVERVPFRGEKGGR